MPMGLTSVPAAIPKPAFLKAHWASQNISELSFLNPITVLVFSCFPSVESLCSCIHFTFLALFPHHPAHYLAGGESGYCFCVSEDPDFWTLEYLLLLRLGSSFFSLVLLQGLKMLLCWFLPVRTILILSGVGPSLEPCVVTGFDGCFMPHLLFCFSNWWPCENDCSWLLPWWQSGGRLISP